MCTRVCMGPGHVRLLRQVNRGIQIHALLKMQKRTYEIHSQKYTYFTVFTRIYDPEEINILSM